jgi:PE-PPE domain
VNGYKVLAQVAAVGAMVGMASASFAQSAHADPDPLAGSDTAIILGGTTEPTPDTAFAQAAEDLYLHPLGFDDGATASTVCDMVGTDPCAAPLQVLTTPELIQQGPSSLTAADDVVLAVENEFTANPGAFSAQDPLTIFGYSQSATAESIAMSRLEADGIHSDDLHFVFIGDPSLPGGIWPNLEPDMDALFGSTATNTILTDLGFDGVLGNVTPDNLYPATIYSLDTDPVANFQEVYETKGFWTALLDIFGPHVEYVGLTPDQVADATTTTDGDLTLVDISDGDVNNVDAWLSAVFEHGAAGSGLLESVIQSLELYFTNTF